MQCRLASSWCTPGNITLLWLNSLHSVCWTSEGSPREKKQHEYWCVCVCACMCNRYTLRLRESKFYRADWTICGEKDWFLLASFCHQQFFYVLYSGPAIFTSHPSWIPSMISWPLPGLCFSPWPLLWPPIASTEFPANSAIRIVVYLLFEKLDP